MDQPQYRYEALGADEIRLLRVTSGRQEASLETFARHQAPPYIALSYTWGPPEDADSRQEVSEATERHASDKHRLPIRSMSTGTPQYYLDVLENLHQLLTEIKRRPIEAASLDTEQSAEVLIWADAICINQSDSLEVSQQVNMMNETYSQASKVLIWLGPDKRGEMPLVEAFLNMFANMHLVIAERSNAGSIRAGDIVRRDMADLLAIVGLPAVDNPQWRIFLQFFKRNWFRRLWIAQEVALAAEIQVWCGPTTLLWQAIEHAAEILNCDLEKVILGADKTRTDTSVVFHSRHAGSLTRIRQWALTSHVPGTFFDVYRLISGRQEYDPAFGYAVLGYISACEVTDPRDKVFGALGLVRKLTGQSEPLGKANYELDICQVYTRTAEKMIADTGWLGTLSLITIPRARRRAGEAPALQELPSWVPTLTSTSVQNLSVEGDERFNATGQFRENFSTRSSSVDVPKIQFSDVIDGIPRRIGFPAFKIATVHQKSEPLDEFYGHKSPFEAGINVLLDAFPAHWQGIYKPTHESLIDAFWQTMIAGGRAWDLSYRNKSMARDGFIKYWLFQHLFLVVLEWNGKKTPPKDYVASCLANFQRLGVTARTEWSPSFGAQSSSSGQHEENETETAEFNLPGHEELLIAVSEMWRDPAWVEGLTQDMMAFSLHAGNWVASRVMLSTRPSTDSDAAVGPVVGASNKGKQKTVVEKDDKKGWYLGLGHEETAEGDEVWITPRGPVPLVLRPLRDASGALRPGVYELIGECYIHGIMYGEVFKSVEAQPVWETIWLE